MGVLLSHSAQACEFVQGLSQQTQCGRDLDPWISPLGRVLGEGIAQGGAPGGPPLWLWGGDAVCVPERPSQDCRADVRICPDPSRSCPQTPASLDAEERRVGWARGDILVLSSGLIVPCWSLAAWTLPDTRRRSSLPLQLPELRCGGVPPVLPGLAHAGPGSPASPGGLPALRLCHPTGLHLHP